MQEPQTTNPVLLTSLYPSANLTQQRVLVIGGSSRMGLEVARLVVLHRELKSSFPVALATN